MCRGEHIAAIQLINAPLQTVVFSPPAVVPEALYFIFLLCQGCFLLHRGKKPWLHVAATILEGTWGLGLWGLIVGCP